MVIFGLDFCAPIQSVACGRAGAEYERNTAREGNPNSVC
jgi:hypothetical protein